MENIMGYKKVFKKDLPVIHVVSEPGDCTKYNYFVIIDHDDYHFVSVSNSFSYPQKINRWDVVPPVSPSFEDCCEDLAKKYNCNPWTAKECMRTAYELHNNLLMFMEADNG